MAHSDPKKTSMKHPLTLAVLSRGNTEDLATMYRNWRGRDPETEAMLHDCGLPGGGEGKTP
jgi:Zn-dependent oligopeptidase